jgi:DNA-binding transcriptional LysR family regulator
MTIDICNFAACTWDMHGMHLERDLDVTQIRLIAELSRVRSISAAAQKIGLSPSAASHALAKLRKQLGDALFTRSADGFHPTPYGERLGAAAYEALEVLRAGLASNRPFDPRTTKRRFNLYLNDVGQIVFLPRLIAFMNKEAPGVTVRSVPIPLESPGAAMSSGEVDLAVGLFINLTTGFIQSLLFRERYVCIVRANHPKFRNGMTLEAFISAQHALADATGMAHAFIDQVLARHRIHRNVAIRVPGFHVLPMIIANSDLVAIIQGRLADAFVARVPIKVLPTPVPIPSSRICMFWHERYHRDPAVSWLRRSFVNLFRPTQ